MSAATKTGLPSPDAAVKLSDEIIDFLKGKFPTANFEEKTRMVAATSMTANALASVLHEEVYAATEKATAIKAALGAAERPV